MNLQQSLTNHRAALLWAEREVLTGARRRYCCRPQQQQQLLPASSAHFGRNVSSVAMSTRFQVLLYVKTRLILLFFLIFLLQIHIVFSLSFFSGVLFFTIWVCFFTMEATRWLTGRETLLCGGKTEMQGNQRAPGGAHVIEHSSRTADDAGIRFCNKSSVCNSDQMLLAL